MKITRAGDTLQVYLPYQHALQNALAMRKFEGFLESAHVRWTKLYNRSDEVWLMELQRQQDRVHIKMAAHVDRWIPLLDATDLALGVASDLRNQGAQARSTGITKMVCEQACLDYAWYAPVETAYLCQAIIRHGGRAKLEWYEAAEDETLKNVRQRMIGFLARELKDSEDKFVMGIPAFCQNPRFILCTEFSRHLVAVLDTETEAIVHDMQHAGESPEQAAYGLIYKILQGKDPA